VPVEKFSHVSNRKRIIETPNMMIQHIKTEWVQTEGFLRSIYFTGLQMATTQSYAENDTLHKTHEIVIR
jgi:hypothetical protein